jgi:hypothetical protein
MKTVIGVAMLVSAGLFLSACEQGLPADWQSQLPADLPQSVEVEFLLDEGSSLPGSDDDAIDLFDEFEFVGVVETQSAQSWTVGGSPVSLSSQTEVKGVISVGDVVKVHARLSPEGARLAREIELIFGDAGGLNASPSTQDEFEFIGPIEAMDGALWMIGALQVTVTPQTEVKGDLSLGVVVKVHAGHGPAGELIAREIEPASSEDLEQDSFEFVGLLEIAAGETWKVGGVEIMVTDQTEIKGDPMVGDLVEIHAYYDGDGRLVAREIEPATQDDLGEDDELQMDEIEFEGEVESMTAGVWVVGGRTVIIETGTEIEPGIEIRSWVEVEAALDENGALIALEIELEDSDDEMKLDSEDDLDDEDHDDDDDEDDEDDDEDEAEDHEDEEDEVEDHGEDSDEEDD